MTQKKTGRAPRLQSPSGFEGRAPFATLWETSRGRLHHEPASATRTPFQRDRDRIIHAQAFRRLKQKTQVFVAHEGDHFRTRLTHSLEVAQIARTIARVLGLDEDLAEAVALAHDLGHPPFGHAGERELARLMTDHGGFDHNEQSLRIVTHLERRYPSFDGLNLSWETLEGLVKHNGPVRGLPTHSYIAGFDHIYPLDLASHAGLEAQIAAMSDDIAYNNHDIDDGVSAGLFTIEELEAAAPLAADCAAGIRADFPGLDQERLLAELVRRLIGIWVSDLLTETRRRLTELGPMSAEEVRSANQPLVGFSPEMREHDARLRRFLFERMYRHWKVNRMMSQAKRILAALFDLFLTEPNTLPPPWNERALKGEAPRARVVCDYLAGMTDQSAIDEYRRIFSMDGFFD